MQGSLSMRDVLTSAVSHHPQSMHCAKMSNVRQLLEINPKACAFVVGPQLTAEGLEDSTLVRSYRTAVCACIDAVCSRVDGAAPNGEQQRQEKLLNVTLELDITVAAQVAVERLRERGQYESWLRETSTVARPEHRRLDSTAHDGIRNLLRLQEQGALLMCTQYDTLLDGVAGTQPVLLNQRAEFEDWARGKRQGFLHLHGVFSSPESVVLCKLDYSQVLRGLGMASTLARLKEVFTQRLVVYLGYDGEFFDPLLRTLHKMLVSEALLQSSPPILLTAQPTLALNQLFLQLPLSQYEMAHLDTVISTGAGQMLTTGKRDEWDPEDLACQAALYFVERQSSSELGSLICQCIPSSKICVSSDTLAITYGQRVLYSILVTCGNGGLKQLWELIHGLNSPLVARGLLAVNLHDSVIVWHKGKPLDLGRITDIKSLPAATYPARNTTSTPSPSSAVDPTTAITTSTSPSQQSPFHCCHHFQTPRPHPYLVAADPLPLLQCTPCHQLPVTPGCTSNQLTTPLLGLPIQPPQSQDTAEEDQSNGDVPLIQYCLAGPPELSLNESLYEHKIACIEQTAQTCSNTNGHCEQALDHTASVPSPPSSLQHSPHKQQKMPPPLLQLSPTPPPESGNNHSNHHHCHHEDHCRHSGHTHQHCTPVLPHSDHLPTHNTSTSTSSNGTTSPVILVSPASLPCIHTGPTVGGYVFVNPVQLMPSPVALAVAPIGSEPVPSVTTVLSTYHERNHPQATMGELVSARPTTFVKQLEKTQPTSPVAEQTSPPLKKMKCMTGPATSPEGDGATNGPTETESPDSCHLCSRLHGSCHSSTESDLSLNQTSAPFTQPQNVQVIDTLGQFRNTGKFQLWEFLLDLLLTPERSSIIRWTGNGYEFKILNPQAVSHLWSSQRNRPTSSYEHLSRALRYYYCKGILDKVPGRRLVFKFSFDVQKYVCARKKWITGTTGATSIR